MLADFLLGMGFGLLFLVMALFHEMGHRLVFNSKFICFTDYRIKGVRVGLANAVWGGKLTPFEYMNGLIAGFVFSLPIVVIVLLFDKMWGITFLIFALASSAFDFYAYFKAFHKKVFFNNLHKTFDSLEEVRLGKGL